MKNPLEQFKRYLKLARRKKELVADNIYLATVDAQGKPHVRTVLLKTFDAKGIGFVTNRLGPKVRQMRESHPAECCMAWPKLWLQVRFAGKAYPMPKKVLQRLWKQRPREAQILYSLGIPQSSPISSYEYLLSRVAGLMVQWRHKKRIPLSSNYTGFVLEPALIEFLHHNPSRLNKRELYTRTKKGWLKTILAP